MSKQQSRGLLVLGMVLALALAPAQAAARPRPEPEPPKSALPIEEALLKASNPDSPWSEPPAPPTTSSTTTLVAPSTTTSTLPSPSTSTTVQAAPTTSTTTSTAPAPSTTTTIAPGPTTSTLPTPTTSTTVQTAPTTSPTTSTTVQPPSTTTTTISPWSEPPATPTTSSTAISPSTTTTGTVSTTTTMAPPTTSTSSTTSTSTEPLLTTTTTASTTSTSATTTTTIPASLPLNLLVNAEWNLLSSTIGFEVSAVFYDADNFASVWKWTTNESGGKSWAVYLPDGSSASYAADKGFLVLELIQPGEGFWVNCKAKETQQLAITGPPDDAPPLPLDPGWNLVGLKALQPPLAVTELEQVISVWAWRNGQPDTKTWAVFLSGQDSSSYATAKGFIVLDTINPGEGFWVNRDE